MSMERVERSLGFYGGNKKRQFSVPRGNASCELKMRMGRPGPGLEPGLMASRPILGVMGRPISPRCYGLDGPLDIMGRPKYFSIILNHEYYQHF